MAFQNSLRRLLGFTTCLLAMHSSQTFAYPDHPVKMVVPFAAGGVGDIGARVLGDEMRKILGVPVIIDNRPGALAVIGSAYIAKAAPDGYTIGYNTNTIHSGGLSLFKKLPFDPVADFAPIALVATTSMVLAVKSDLPVKSVAELLDWLKAHPEAASYSFHNSATQVAGATFLKRSGSSATPVPYVSPVAAMTDVSGGSTAFGFVELGVARPLIAGGRIKVLAISSAKRSVLLPEVPTVAESGLPNFDIASWNGIFAPAGTPPDVITRLSEVVRQALAQPSVRDKFTNIGSSVEYLNTRDFAEFLSAQQKEWADRIAEAGIQPQ